MDGLVIVVLLGGTILLSGLLAQRLRLPPALVAVCCGVIIGLIPIFDGLSLPPELLLTVFIPALLYWESLNTSLREIRRNWLAITSLSVGLVLVTAAAVTLVAHALGMSWELALVLGAILAPTDATAIETVLKFLPRRWRTVLQTESLINDGTALVLYGVALSTLLGKGRFEVAGIAGQFVYSYVVAVVIGVLVGLAAAGVRLLIRGERLLNSTISLVTPFVAFYVAELVNVSGVVAVVTTGLLLSQIGPHIITASMRMQSFGFWQFATFLLNTALFILIGFEVSNLAGAGMDGWARGVGIGAICAIVVIVLRCGWVSVTPFAHGTGRSRSGRVPAPFRERAPLAWAGFRGAVSLAAALSIPVTDASGAVIEGRTDVVVAATTVILITLILQGLTMPAVLRLARFVPDSRESDEQILAERTALQAALDSLPEAADTTGVSAGAVEEERLRLQQLLAAITSDGDGRDFRKDRTVVDEQRDIELALIPKQRAALFSLRRRNLIDDVVLRRVQGWLDADELRLTRSDDSAT